MIVFKELKLLQKLMGLNPQGGFENTVVRLIYLVIFSLSLFMYTTYFILNIHGNITETFGALSAIFGSTLHCTNYLHFLVGRNRIQSLLDDLQLIVNERIKSVDVEGIYIRAGQQASFAAKIVIYVLLGILVLSLSPFVLAAIDWCLGKYTIDSWTFFYSFGVPFQLNTTLRCASEVLFEAFLTTCCLVVVSSIPILLIGCMKYSKICYLDINSLFVQVNRLSKPKSPKKSNCKHNRSDLPVNKGAKMSISEIPKPPQRKSLELKMRELCKEAVVLHQKVNRLLNNLADTMNGIIFGAVSLSTVCICGCLLVIAKYHGTNFLYDLQMAATSALVFLNILYMFFYMSQKYNTNSMELSNAIYQTEWYQYPRSVQLFVLHMMMRSQQPFFLSAFGIIELNLENFVGLMNRIYSALMILRSMD